MIEGLYDWYRLSYQQSRVKGFWGAFLGQKPKKRQVKKETALVKAVKSMPTRTNPKDGRYPEMDEEVNDSAFRRVDGLDDEI